MIAASYSFPPTVSSSTALSKGGKLESGGNARKHVLSGLARCCACSSTSCFSPTLFFLLALSPPRTSRTAFLALFLALETCSSCVGTCGSCFRRAHASREAAIASCFGPRKDVLDPAWISTLLPIDRVRLIGQ
eukprot:scaffold656_cov403-Pavlova_lutheri.AAC.54